MPETVASAGKSESKAELTLKLGLADPYGSLCGNIKYKFSGEVPEKFISFVWKSIWKGGRVPTKNETRKAKIGIKRIKHEEQSCSTKFVKIYESQT